MSDAWDDFVQGYSNGMVACHPPTHPPLRRLSAATVLEVSLMAAIQNDMLVVTTTKMDRGARRARGGPGRYPPETPTAGGTACVVGRGGLP
jgi:hypothetical protein